MHVSTLLSTRASRAGTEVSVIEEEVVTFLLAAAFDAAAGRARGRSGPLMKQLRQSQCTAALAAQTQPE